MNTHTERLIKVHHRRRDLLIQQHRALGSNAPRHILTEIQALAEKIRGLGGEVTPYQPKSNQTPNQIERAAGDKPEAAPAEPSNPPPPLEKRSLSHNKEDFSALVGSAIGWMYGNRDLLRKGYSGEDPNFSQAKAKYLAGKGDLSPSEKEELLKAFEKALKRV